MIKLLEVQEIVYELQSAKEVVDSALSLVDEGFKSLSAIYNEFLVSTLQTFF